MHRHRDEGEVFGDDTMSRMQTRMERESREDRTRDRGTDDEERSDDDGEPSRGERERRRPRRRRDDDERGDADADDDGGERSGGRIQRHGRRGGRPRGGRDDEETGRDPRAITARELSRANQGGGHGRVPAGLVARQADRVRLEHRLGFDADAAKHAWEVRRVTAPGTIEDESERASKEGYIPHAVRCPICKLAPDAQNDGTLANVYNVIMTIPTAAASWGADQGSVAWSIADYWQTHVWLPRHKAGQPCKKLSLELALEHLQRVFPTGETAAAKSARYIYRLQDEVMACAKKYNTETQQTTVDEKMVNAMGKLVAMQKVIYETDWGRGPWSHYTPVNRESAMLFAPVLQLYATKKSEVCS